MEKVDASFFKDEVGFYGINLSVFSFKSPKFCLSLWGILKLHGEMFINVKKSKCACRFDKCIVLKKLMEFRRDNLSRSFSRESSVYRCIKDVMNRHML